MSDTQGFQHATCVAIVVDDAHMFGVATTNGDIAWHRIKCIGNNNNVVRKKKK